MARNKEKLVLLLDVGPSMHGVLSEVEKLCSMLVEKKLIFSKYDELGVVVFGTEESNNDLTTEVGGYQNITVLQDIKVVDGDLVDTLQKLPRGTVDVLDAIVVGMDMLIKKYKDLHKGKKRLCLITNAIHPIKDSFEGSKEDQVMTIAEQMAAQGMKIESIVVRGRLSRDANKGVMDENDHLLSIFSKKTRTRTVYVDTPTSLLGALKTRRVTPVTVFRGHLELSPQMKIKVWVYKKTQEEKFPTLKKYSEKAPASNKLATHQVKVSYEYKSVDGSSTSVIPPEQRIKGYRYGPQVVPISTAEWDAVKFKPEKGIKVLGFTDASKIKRHCYMKDVYLFIAEPGNTRATLAVSAIARAMKEMNAVAILRCVWRQGQQNVVVGVLTPNISQNDKIPDSFYFNVLPFAEDVREYQFPSFNSFPASWQPNDQQQKAADELVQMLDLAPSGKEALLPEFTPNPVLERFYRHLELKAKQPDAAVPPLDETLKKIIEPDPELVAENKSVFGALHRHFELKQNPKLKKSSRQWYQEKQSGSNAHVSGGQAVNSIENQPPVKIEKIGDLTPVRDFEAMMSQRDNPEWVEKAIKELREKILALLIHSDDGDKYQKAMECVAALRKGCIIEQEPGPYNDLMHHIRQYCEEKGIKSLPQLLASRDLTLISKSEAEDSDVTAEEARSFFVKKEPKPDSNGTC
ncbi:ATP-dependent DNA helicase 2 subunit KU80-like [Gossypium australe]|uniref:ATP-dependent DNA helicase 2 subunit KU80 n=1 Tax=Gossypium australe TaxID=47621 RepID=A0A5B6W217_9ROSI|nr:ATP-dependent DNA helicase 2 subunit KU80-like [Gossypium australe]